MARLSLILSFMIASCTTTPVEPPEDEPVPVPYGYVVFCEENPESELCK